MDQVPAQFCQSLAMLKKVDECAVAFQIGSLIYTSRDSLCKKAIKMGADYVFWLDSDMVFNPDVLEQMFKNMEKDTIVTGLYFRRAAPFSPVLFDTLEVIDGKVEHNEFEDIPDVPFEVGGCGFGCVLMPTEAAVAVALNYQQMFTPMVGAGEDLSFCWRARQSGYKIICDPRIPLGHVGHTVVNAEFYNAYKGAKK